MDIPTEMIEGAYLVDAETEGTLESGEDLKVGMVALLMNYGARNSFASGVALMTNGSWKTVDDGASTRLLRKNRHWCKVIGIETIRGHSLPDYIVVECIYGDGWHIKRSVPLNHSWIYKKRSDTPK